MPPHRDNICRAIFALPTNVVIAMSSDNKSAEKTLERRLYILSALPEYPSDGMSVTRLLALLQAQGLLCDRRTVQRDLKEMAATWLTLGLLLRNENEHQEGVAGKWRHEPGSKARLLSTISHEYALLLNLAKRELQALLPQSLHARIQEPLDSAQQMLDYPHHARHARYLQSIRVLPDGPQRVAPAPTAMLGQINDALFHSHQLKLRYASVKHGVKDYLLHPVGLVQKGLFYWLLAVKDGVDPQSTISVQSFRHDRMRDVELLPHHPLARNLPTLEQAMHDGRHEFMVGESIHLKLRFAASIKGKELCDSFRDAPLGAGQVISEDMEPGFLLTTTVRASLQLNWLLQRYADRIKVLEPVHLSQQLREFAQAAAALQT